METSNINDNIKTAVKEKAPVGKILKKSLSMKLLQNPFHTKFGILIAILKE